MLTFGLFFIILYMVIYLNFIQNIDYAVVEFMSGFFKNDFLDAVMPLITLLGEIGIFWIFCAVIMLTNKSTRKIGATCALSMIIDFISCNVLLKNIVARPRPDIIFWNENLFFTPHDWSFPSGHTAVSFAAAAAILLYNRKLGIPAVIIAILIGFSRVYLCVHWFSDVFCGALLGILCALLAYFAVKFITDKKSVD